MIIQSRINKPSNKQLVLSCLILLLCISVIKKKWCTGIHCKTGRKHNCDKQRLHTHTQWVYNSAERHKHCTRNTVPLSVHCVCRCKRVLKMSSLGGWPHPLGADAQIRKMTFDLAHCCHGSSGSPAHGLNGEEAGGAQSEKEGIRDA